MVVELGYNIAGCNSIIAIVFILTIYKYWSVNLPRKENNVTWVSQCVILLSQRKKSYFSFGWQIDSKKVGKE